MRTIDTLFVAVLAIGPMAYTHAQDRFLPEQGEVVTWSRTDHVLSDLATHADKRARGTFKRTASLGDDGLFHVRAVSPEGVTRMEGTYLDSTLTKPHGAFTFYHSNGRVESKGLYANGIKTGRWECWSITGEPRAVRDYAGLPWDELQFVVGAAEKARTVKRENEPVAVF